MSGGWIIFAMHRTLLDEESEFTMEHAGKVGTDIMSLFEVIRLIWPRADGNQNSINIWHIRHKRFVGNVRLAAHSIAGFSLAHLG